MKAKVINHLNTVEDNVRHLKKEYTEEQRMLYKLLYWIFCVVFCWLGINFLETICFDLLTGDYGISYYSCLLLFFLCVMGITNLSFKKDYIIVNSTPYPLILMDGTAIYTNDNIVILPGNSHIYTKGKYKYSFDEIRWIERNGARNPCFWFHSKVYFKTTEVAYFSNKSFTNVRIECEPKI
jgi:hypothetical protein